MSWRRIVVAIWCVSTLTLLVEQANGLRRDAQAAAAGISVELQHQGIPMDDQERIQKVLARCQRLMRPEQRLGVLFREQVVAQHFLSYRLLYLRYPSIVVSYPYGSFSGEPKARRISRMTLRRAFAWLKSYDVDYLLVLGMGRRVFRGTRYVEQPSPEDVLLEVL